MKFISTCLVAATAILAPMNLGGVEVMSGRAPGRGADGLSQITHVAAGSEATDAVNKAQLDAVAETADGTAYRFKANPSHFTPNLIQNHINEYYSARSVKEQIDAAYVDQRLGELASDEDLSRYVL